MARLRLLKGGRSQESFVLDAAESSVGKSEDCRIHLRSRFVSRHHAMIVQRTGAHFILDTESRNGTYLNGKKLAPRVEHHLKNNDVIHIGNFILTFLEAESDSSEGYTLRAHDNSDTALEDDSSVSAILDSSPEAWLERSEENAQRKLRMVMKVTRDLFGALTLDEVRQMVTSLGFTADSVQMTSDRHWTWVGEKG